MPVPPAAVYAVIEDPATYPDWLVGADRIRAIDPAFPDAGTTFDHSVGPGGPITIDDQSESIKAEPNRLLVLRVHARRFHARVEFELCPRPDGGTDMTLREQPIGLFAKVTPVLRPSLYARNLQSLKQLRDLLTAGDPA